MHFTVVLAGIGVSLIFGLSFLFTKNALDFIPPMTLLSYRFLVAFIFFAILLAFRVIRIERKPYWKLWKLVLFQPILYFIFEAYGVQRIKSAEAGMIIALIPIVVNVLAVFILKEKADFLHYLLVVLGFVGVIFIVGVDLSLDNILGKILMLLAVLSAGFYTVLSRKLIRQFTAEQITFFMMLTGFLFFATITIARGEMNFFFNLQTLISVLYLGILSSAVAFFLLNYMVKRASPTLTTLFSNFTTVVSVVAGVIFRDETVKVQQVVGMAFILVSLLLATLRKKKVSNN
ncbi:MAG: DMT family transporter [Pseudothermotoga sp.]